MKDMKSLQQEVTEATPCCDPSARDRRLLDVLRPGSSSKKRSKSSSIRRFATSPSCCKLVSADCSQAVLEVDLMHYRQLEQLPPQAVTLRT